MEENKNNSKNNSDKLDKESLKKVAGGIWDIHYDNKGFVSGPGFIMMQTLGRKFNPGWLSDASWHGKLVQALVDVFGAEAANDIVHKYNNPQIFFAVLQNDGYHLDVLPHDT